MDRFTLARVLPVAFQPKTEGGHAVWAVVLGDDFADHAGRWSFGAEERRGRFFAGRCAGAVYRKSIYPVT